MGMYRAKADQYDEEWVLSNSRENAALAFANKQSLVGTVTVYVYNIFDHEWEEYRVTIEPIAPNEEYFPSRTPGSIRLKHPEDKPDSYRGKRIGVFSLPAYMIWEMPVMVKFVMGKMIILYAQWNPEQSEITYMAICDDFDEVMVSDENPMDYSEIPGYGILVEANGIRITREK